MPRPDEGLIHAWLDGQLPSDEAARIEQLAATDPEWAAAVAEARGFVAASSRILSALDNVPAGVIPQRTAPRTVRPLPWWTKVAAAVVIVAGGSVLVVQRSSAPVIATAPVVRVAPPVAGTANAPTPANALQPQAVLNTPTPVTPKNALPRETPRTADAPQRAVSVEANVHAIAGASSEARAAAPPPAPLALQGVVGSQSEASQTRQGMRGDSGRAASQLLGNAIQMMRDAQSKDIAAERVANQAGAAKTFAAAAKPSVADSAVTSMKSATPAAMAAPALRAVGGVAAERATPTRQRIVCYLVRSANAAADAGIVMRFIRMDADTLRLEPALGTSTLRAWAVWSDSVGRGAMTATNDRRGAVPVIVTRSACAVP